MRQELRTVAAIEVLRDTLGAGPWPLGALRDVGWSDRQIRRAVDAGRLRRPHRGVVDLPDAVGEAARVWAALLVAGEKAAASHESAARLRALWLPRDASNLVHLTVPGCPDRTDHGMRIHGSRLPREYVEDLDGVPVTTLARTAIDLARGRELPEAMVVVDSAARAIISTSTGVDLRALRDGDQRHELTEMARDALQTAFEVEWTWPGTVVARGAIELMNPASESPFESRSRGWMVQAALPAPQLAYSVQGASGTWYVADFAWPGQRLLGEADGIGKYGTDPVGAARALRAERRRQRDLEDAGWRFVRWDSAEHPRQVTTRIARALVATHGASH